MNKGTLLSDLAGSLPLISCSGGTLLNSAGFLLVQPAMDFASDEQYQEHRQKLEERRIAALRDVDQAAVDRMSGKITEAEANRLLRDADNVLAEYAKFALQYCRNSGRHRSKNK